MPGYRRRRTDPRALPPGQSSSARPPCAAAPCCCGCGRTSPSRSCAAMSRHGCQARGRRDRTDDPRARGLKRLGLADRGDAPPRRRRFHPAPSVRARSPSPPRRDDEPVAAALAPLLARDGRGSGLRTRSAASARWLCRTPIGGHAWLAGDALHTACHYPASGRLGILCGRDQRAARRCHHLGEKAARELLARAPRLLAG